MNIFGWEYTLSEIKKVQLKECFIGNIKLEYKTILKNQRLTGYMEHEVFSPKEMKIPVFSINGEVWMSCTPMEMASHYVPIKKAKGKIGIGGLGMGYFLLKAMAKKSVQSIDVYELDDKVIEVFKKLYQERKGFEKINFIQGDIFENLVNKEYDFFYNDIYPTLGSEEASEDMLSIKSNNKIKVYHYWGLEYDLYHAVRQGSIFALNLINKDKVLTKVFKDWEEFNPEYIQFEEKTTQRLMGKKEVKSFQESLAGILS